MPIHAVINERELELFRNYLYKNSGILIPTEKAYLFETRLSKIMLDAGTATFTEFYSYILSGADSQIKQKIIDAMSNNETLWFRDASPWKVIEELLLPQLIKKLQSGEKKKIRIWSSAVSTGQEIYSTVMCVDNYLKKNRIIDVKLSDFEFFATDISSRVLNIAKDGIYDKMAISRGLDDYYKSRYFVNDKGLWKLDHKIRDAVNFVHFNLQSSFQKFSDFDIIFCRYVLIYFSSEMAQEVIEKVYNSLKEDGTFFIGSYILYDMFEKEFETKHYNNFTYFTKKGSSLLSFRS